MIKYTLQRGWKSETPEMLTDATEGRTNSLCCVTTLHTQEFSEITIENKAKLVGTMEKCDKVDRIWSAL